MHEPAVLVAHDGPVATVTLNRPRVKNALDAEAWRALMDAFVAFADDPGVHVVVVTGAGGAFCSGADLTDASRAEMHPLDRMRRINRVAQVLHELPKPTVAKVEGVAVGAGWNLALGCDLVVASTTARFSQIFARRGLSVDFGGSWLLPRLVGLQQAKRLALLADFIGAAEAREAGLVTWVTEPEELDAFVADLAARLAAGPPVALAQTKALLNASSERSLAQALEAEAGAQAVNSATADASAARTAFMERREPVFTGRWQLQPPGDGTGEH